MNAGHWTDLMLERERQRQRELMRWELTLFQIWALPETKDCPPEERI